MSRLRLLAFAVLAAAFVFAGTSLSASPQGFFRNDLTLHGTETAGGKTQNVTTYLSANAMKQSSSDGNDSITRLDEGKFIFIDNKKKTYSEITFQQMQDMMNAVGSASKDLPPEAQAMMKKMMGGGSDAPITVTAAGAGETVAGYATQKYLVTGPMAMEIMAAPDLKIPTQYYDALSARMAANPMFDMKKLYAEMKKINGWPMKQTTTMKVMGREMTSVSVVTSVDKTPIPASTFAVPAGYKKTEFMQK